LDLSQLQSFLGWCLVINYVLLFVWFGLLQLAGAWVVGIHSRLFHIDEDQVRSFHFQMMGQFKLLIMVFNIAPWLALIIIQS